MNSLVELLIFLISIILLLYITFFGSKDDGSTPLLSVSNAFAVNKNDGSIKQVSDKSKTGINDVFESDKEMVRITCKVPMLKQTIINKFNSMSMQQYANKLKKDEESCNHELNRLMTKFGFIAKGIITSEVNKSNQIKKEIVKYLKK